MDKQEIKTWIFEVKGNSYQIEGLVSLIKLVLGNDIMKFEKKTFNREQLKKELNDGKAKSLFN